MKCDTCNAPTAGTDRTCVEGHHHSVCPACVWRYWVAFGQPIRCIERGWDGRATPAGETPASPPPPDTTERPPF